MDDPWGSPWSTVEPRPTTKSSDGVGVSQSGVNLEIEPKTSSAGDRSDFISTEPVAVISIPILSGPSPWADDNDDFGEWTDAVGQTGDAGTTSPAAVPAVDFGVWGLTEKQPGADDAVFNGHHRWPVDVTPAKAEGSLHVSFPTSTVRYPSPDPWASTIHDLAETTDSSGRDNGALEADRVVAAAADDWLHNVESRTEHVVEADASRSKSIDNATPNLLNQEHQPVEEPKSMSVWSVDEHADTVVADSAPSLVTSTDTLGDDIGRRSSSAGSYVPAISHGSPGTSVDDETLAPSISAPASRPTTRVQELVDLFDGLAKGAIEVDPQSRVASGTHRSLSRVADSRTDASKQSQEGQSSEADNGQPGGDKVGTKPITDYDAISSGGNEERTRVESGPPEEAADSKSEISEQAGHFKIDLGLVDQLYPQPALPSRPPSPSAPISDRPLTDTFSSISERKAWYRVSRAGPMRQHNSGDEGHYVRVNWPSSTVREDVVAIVRRWMEQDSISGRAVLGFGWARSSAAAGKGNVFGWDTDGPVIDLREALGKRKENERRQVAPPQQQQPPPAMAGWTPAHTSGASRSWSTENMAHDQAASMTKTTSASAAVGAPDLGWSSSGEATLPPAKVESVPTRALPAVGNPMPPPTTPPSSAISSLVPPPAPHATPAAAGASNGTLKLVSAASAPSLAAAEDDDEWGELVSPADEPELEAGSQQMTEAFGSGFVRQLPAVLSPGTSVGGAHDASGHTVDLKPGHPQQPPSLKEVERLQMDLAVPGTSSTSVSKSRDIPNDEDEAIAARIVARLPNLSYMLG